jgi:hypothetical protein
MGRVEWQKEKEEGWDLGGWNVKIMGVHIQHPRVKRERMWNWSRILEIHYWSQQSIVTNRAWILCNLNENGVDSIPYIEGTLAGEGGERGDVME